MISTPKSSTSHDSLRLQMSYLWREVRFHITLYNVLSRVSKPRHPTRLLFSKNGTAGLPAPLQSRRGRIRYVARSLRQTTKDARRTGRYDIYPDRSRRHAAP